MNFIFIHGLGCSIKSFSALIEEMDHMVSEPGMVTFNSIALPRSSTKSNPHPDFNKLAQQIAAMSSDAQNVVIVAHSMGSAIALPLAELLEKKLYAIVLIEGNLVGADCGTFSRDLADLVPKDLPDKLLSKLGSSDSQGWQQMRIDFQKYGKQFLIDYAKELVKVSDEGKLLEIFSQLECKKLFLYGDDYAGIGTKPEAAILDQLPDDVTKKYIPETSHFLMQEYPACCAKHILEILK